MQFISTREAAEKWGITANRISILARAGRIPGSRLFGNRWMIPENAPKPQDARFHAVGAEGEQDSFRYPAFEHRNPAAFVPPLCEEELRIQSSLEHIYACRFAEAEAALGDLPWQSRNRYLRITALRISCTYSIFLNQSSGFLDAYGSLETELQQDFPHRAEMQTLLHEIDATLGYSLYFTDDFFVDSLYSYHRSFLPHLAALSTIALFCSNDKTLTAPELLPYEISCAVFDNGDSPVDTQSMHIYLGCIYALLGHRERADRHLRRALELAEQYELYYGVVMEYYYMEKVFEPVLEGFSEGFRQQIRILSEEMHTRYIRFMDTMAMNSIYKLLPHREFIFILYAAQGLRNREVAQLLGISEAAVSRKYSDIYSQLGVKSKKELLALYYTSLRP